MIWSFPASFEAAADQHAIIKAAEIAYHFDHYCTSGAVRLDRETRDEIEVGPRFSAFEYIAARTYQNNLCQQTEALFEHCDVLICATALGAAPEGLKKTGDSILNDI